MASKDVLSDFVIGYPKLAAKFDILPEIAMYRTFGALNAQDLLYRQAELIDLEEKLREQQVNDRDDKLGYRSQYAVNWDKLADSDNDGGTDQLDLVMEIREKLKEYNDALIQQSKILKFKKPARWERDHIQSFLQRREMGPLALTGSDATTWGSETYPNSYSRDLVTLHPRAKKDAFSMWAAENTIVNLFRCGCTRFMKPSPIHGVVGYEDSTIYRITYAITSIIAGLIPIASIAVLYRVQSMSARLGIIAAFNVLVSICLMGFAGAKRAEVFAITAAFAAVQVVFVGQDRSV